MQGNESETNHTNPIYEKIKEKTSGYFDLDRFFTFIHERRLEKFYKIVLSVFVSLLVGFVVYGNIFIPFMNIKVGETALRDIKAPQNMKVFDEKGTSVKIKEALKEFKPYYMLIPDSVVDSEERVRNAFAKGREIANKDSEPYTVEQYKKFCYLLGKRITVRSYELLVEGRFSKELEDAIVSSIDFLRFENVVVKKDLQYGELNNGLILTGENGKEKYYPTIDNFLDIDNAIRLSQERLQRKITPSSLKYIPALNDVVANTVAPNIVLDKQATEKKMASVKSAVEPEYFSVKTGEIIVKGGDIVTEEDIVKLNTLFKSYSSATRLFYIAGISFVFALLLKLIYTFTTRSIRKVSPQIKDLTFLAVTLAGSVILIKIYVFMAGSVAAAFSSIPLNFYYYALPVAAAAMLIRLILNSEIALIFSFILSILAGVILDFSLPITIYAFLSSVMGAQGVAMCQDRGTITKAGIKVGCVNAAFVGFYSFVQGNVDLMILVAICFGFAGGIFSAVIVTGLTQIFESLFNYTTNIKLLELANLEHPLLKKMMVEAPGSYHHSIVIGTMVEAVAPTVRANPLLCKVGAYYHDIGKMKKPLYFIENQIVCENKHDKLSPNMSSLIIMSHIKDGIELAKKYRLGEKIIDIIQQHHGTGFISYFYQKAKSLEGKSMQTISENDFRYPGPKPQTREAAIVLLADAVEAASKTLHDPLPARIQGMVQKIINNIFTEGQLDECELTLKDLHEIAKVFINVLTGMLHQRIDYFEPVTKENIGRKKQDESIGTKSSETGESRTFEDKKKNGENLKRLGIKKV